MRITTPSSIPIYLCALVLVSSGCTTTGLNMSFMAEKHQKESLDNPVEQIIPVWRESEGPGLNPQTVSRGFAGQIYFITQNRGLPSEVNGKVRIYVFDDQGSPEDLAKPIHQFDYEVEGWKAHLSMSKLGPAYSVFIPYTREGRKMAECALRIRYTPVNGTPVFSQMVAITVSGTKADTEMKGPDEHIAVPALSKRGKPALRKVAQVSAKGDIVELNRVQNAMHETSPRLPKTGNRVPRPSRKPARKVKPSNAQDAFMGQDVIDLPEDEESVEELISDTLDPDSASDVEPMQQDEAQEETEDDDSEQTVRTFTIPLNE